MPPITNQKFPQYSFNPLPTGKVQIMENGKDISTTGFGFEPSYASQLGYTAPSPAKEPTVLSSDQTDKISKMQATVDQGLKSGIQTGPDGKQYNPDGTLAQTPEERAKAAEKAATSTTTADGTKKSANPNDANFDLTYARLHPEESPENKQIFEIADNLKSSGDAYFAREIENIKKQYAGLIEEQKRANASSEASRQTSLLMAGTSRYAPLSETGVMHEQVSYGLSKISDLVVKENAAILAIQKAMQEQDMKLAEKKMNLLSDIRDKRQEAMTKISDDIEKQRAEMVKSQEELAKERRQQEVKNKENIDDIVKDAGKNFAPPEIINAISQAKSVGEAVRAAGQYLQTASGDLGEALAIQRDYVSRGLASPPLDELLVKVANQKRLAAEAAATASGLNAKELQTFIRISDKFQADKIISTAQQATMTRQIADQVIANPGNAGNQLIGLYTLIKSLDVDSAVREGELTLAQATQSYLSRFSTEFEKISNGKIISSQSAIELANATKSLADKWEQAGQRREKQYKAQAKTAGVENAFNEYLGNSDLNYGKKIVDQAQEEQTIIDTYIDNHPDQAERMAAMADIPGSTPALIVKWINNQPK